MEVEFGGVKFTGGKMFAVITALTTLIGALYGSFEVYKDYMDMKAKIANYSAPDLSGFDKRLDVLQAKMVQMETVVTETSDYTRDIKNDLRDDLVRMERIVDNVEDDVNASEDKVRNMIDIAEQRFANKRDQVTSDTDVKLKDLEDRLNKKLQRALDNPLAN